MHMLHSSIEYLTIVHPQHLPKYGLQQTNTKDDNMAFMDQTFAKSDNLGVRALAAATGFFATATARYARYSLYRNTLAELNTLSDREAADLGMHRSGFRHLAWETACEKIAV